MSPLFGSPRNSERQLQQSSLLPILSFSSARAGVRRRPGWAAVSPGVCINSHFSDRIPDKQSKGEGLVPAYSSKASFPHGRGGMVAVGRSMAVRRGHRSRRQLVTWHLQSRGREMNAAQLTFFFGSSGWNNTTHR